MTPPQVLVRLYEPPDEEAVRKICMDTAMYGEPIQGLIDDEDLICTLWLRYYLRYEVRHTWIAEADGKVVGYRTGCHDTARYERIFFFRILPGLVLRCFRKGHWANPWFWKLAWYGLLRVSTSPEGWEKIKKEYPAHCHINIAPHARHMGIGTQLLETFLMDLRLNGVSGIRVSVASPAGKQFYLRHGFQVLAQKPAVTLAPGFPGIVYTLGRKLYFAPTSR